MGNDTFTCSYPRYHRWVKILKVVCFYGRSLYDKVCYSLLCGPDKSIDPPRIHSKGPGGGKVLAAVYLGESGMGWKTVLYM